MAIKVQGSPVIYDDRSFNIKTGTTAQRPTSPVDGTLWYNTELSTVERYDASTSQWASAAGQLMLDGDVQYFSQDPGAGWVAADGSILLQSGNPTLFNKIGIIKDGTYNNWTNRTSPSGTTSIYSLIYQNNLFVCGGQGGVIQTSTDAITWTASSSGTTSSIYGLTYGNGLYVYVGVGGLLRTSTDAVTWTARSSGVTTSINAVAFGNGRFIYGSSNGQVRTSTNGITWSGVQLLSTTTAIRAVAFGNGLYIAAAGNGLLYTSTNASNWTSRDSGTTSAILDITYGNGLYVYVGIGGLLRTSTDAVTWTARSSGTLNQLNSVIYGDGLYMLAGSEVMRTSTNGFTWTARTSGVGTRVSIESLAYGNNTFVRGGDLSRNTDEQLIPYTNLATTPVCTYDPSIEFRVPQYPSLYNSFISCYLKE